MKELAEKLEALKVVLFYTAIVVPFYAYLTFYLVYPVICVIPIGTYSYTMLLYVLYSILIALPLGILIESSQHAFLVVLLGSIFGYIVAVVYQAFPYFIYGYSLYTSDILILRFVEFSWLAMIFYMMFGLIGLMFGGYIRDKIE